MRVLVVEDDSNIRRGVVDHFAAQGWQVSEAMDGQLGLELALDQPFDVLVLDVMLPRVNGFDICRAVRREGKQIPVIMLTAKSSEEDVLQGFGSGATDYVRKPFSLAELTVRVKSRVGIGGGNEELESAPFRLNLSTRTVCWNTHSCQLTDKEAKVFTLLLQNEGKVLTREHILNQVWGNAYMQGTRSVDRCVKTLRKKIEIDSKNPQWITTVRQVGYLYTGAS